MRAYPLAKRQAVLEACDAGQGTRQVAQEFSVSESWVRRLKRTRGRRRPAFRRMSRNRVPLWAEFEEQIVTLFRDNPEMKLRELKVALETDLSLSTIGRAVMRLVGRQNRP